MRWPAAVSRSEPDTTVAWLSLVDPVSQVRRHYRGYPPRALHVERLVGDMFRVAELLHQRTDTRWNPDKRTRLIVTGSPESHRLRHRGGGPFAGCGLASSVAPRSSTASLPVVIPRCSCRRTRARSKCVLETFSQHCRQAGSTHGHPQLLPRERVRRIGGQPVLARNHHRVVVPCQYLRVNAWSPDSHHVQTLNTLSAFLRRARFYWTSHSPVVHLHMNAISPRSSQRRRQHYW